MASVGGTRRVTWNDVERRGMTGVTSEFEWDARRQIGVRTVYSELDRS